MNASEVKRPNLYIEKLLFNNGESLEIGKGDIVVFVGPNNVGKSRTLRDIYACAGNNKSGVVVVSSAKFSQSSYNAVSEWLSAHHLVTDEGNCRTYYGMQWSVNQYQVSRAVGSGTFGEVVDAFLCQLDTAMRLNISRPPDAVGRRSQPAHPVHVLVKDPTLLQRVSTYFDKAFGVGLIPFVGYGKTIPLCVGEDPGDDNRANLTGMQREALFLKALDALPQLHEQGDGMRSFAGIMLYLVLDFYNVFLVDEPEAFLHPPQATLIGNVVGELLAATQQAFISTHSIHFINGLLEKAPDRVKIVRITREGNHNTISTLENSRLLEISKDPFLKHSSLLEGMFYKNVVLCEGDADCMFYSMLNSAADMKGVKGTETLFTHCGGKQRMSKVIGALKELKVDIKVIPDFDVLNNESILKELVQVCGGEWGQIERDYNVLISDIKQRANVGETGADILKKISAELSDAMEIVVSQTKMRNIREMLSSNTEWDRLKEAGVSGIGAGNPCQSCKAVLSYLATIGIHVVHCGELERFVPVIGGHGQNWLHAVLDKYPDVSDSVYNAAKDFVRSWRL